MSGEEDDRHHYFAYGPNMAADRMKQRCPGATNRRPGTLEDHKLTFNKATNDFDGSAAANIEKAPGEHVEGALYTLDEKDLLLVDQIEGHPRHYTRRLHAVLEADGTKTIAWAYHATPTYVRNGLRPREEYVQALLAGSDVLSEAYLARMKHMPVYE